MSMAFAATFGVHHNQSWLVEKSNGWNKDHRFQGSRETDWPQLKSWLFFV